ncbi:MAG: hypothetical protein LBN24_09845 [Mediterranea sp.]|jgi:hypothetical protein|nr:hypothetical protein [Mediterranea sp.]
MNSKKTFISVIAFFCYLSVIPIRADNVAPLDSIQSSIEKAFHKSMEDKSAKLLTSIEEELKKKPHNQIYSYWIAYDYLYQAFFFLATQNDNMAKEKIKAGFELFQDEKRKNSEDYALLAYLQSMYIRFTSGIESGVMAQKSANSARQSVEADSTNIRAWYILGMLDYYTPKQFGGKKRCEEYLKKALSLPAQEVENPYMPSWGRVESYMLLLDFYINNQEIQKAHAYLDKALSEFPHEPRLKIYEKYF